MNEKHSEVKPESVKVSGQEARRNFLKRSGKVAIAAPAAVLLLSAASKSAQAQVTPYTGLDDVLDSASPLPTSPV